MTKYACKETTLLMAVQFIKHKFYVTFEFESLEV